MAAAGLNSDARIIVIRILFLHNTLRIESRELIRLRLMAGTKPANVTGMVKGYIWAGTGAAALWVAVATTNATPVYLGSANLSNSGDDTEAAWVRKLITDYNTAKDPDLPTLLGQSANVDAPWHFGKTEITDDPKTETDDVKSFSFSLPAGCDYGYLLLKWGGGNKNPFEHQVWYVEAGDAFAATSPIYVKSTTKAKGKNGAIEIKTGQGGLSHWDLWCHEEARVPDGATTLALLGVGLLGLVGARRMVA
jgi:hypothetical protein